MYITDECNHRVRKVTVSTGIITTIAGTGSSGYSGDNGAATSATIYFPEAVILDSSGISSHSDTFLLCYLIFRYSLDNIYISDSGNYAIRKITISTGIITTIAGTGATSTNIGDGGAATSATLYPRGLGLDAAGTP